jgi:ribulose 1,5-bisphosphate synthetase/thiazole synthase
MQGTSIHNLTMWSLISSLLALSSLSVSASPLDRHCECEEHPVCIIGAGPAGLAAAGGLEQKTVIFDRQEEVGGISHLTSLQVV